nr:hypothetical protein CFP56_04195 [Quercus suber]
MLIALFAGLSGVAVLATCLKRRHDRRADQIRNGFNSGITTRSTAKGVADPAHGSALPPAPPVYPSTTDIEPGPTRDSPARSRNAFMPYGYGYSYSDPRHSPGPRAQIPLDDIEKVAMMEGGGQQMMEGALKREGKRVLVRERSEEHEKS